MFANLLNRFRRKKPKQVIVETRTSQAAKPYFVIKAMNGEVIATSEEYESGQACNKTIKIFTDGFTVKKVVNR